MGWKFGVSFLEWNGMESYLFSFPRTAGLVTFSVQLDVGYSTCLPKITCRAEKANKIHKQKADELFEAKATAGKAAARKPARKPK